MIILELFLKLQKIFIGTQRLFSEILISKMVVKMNFRMISKKYTADPEIRLLTKSILELFGLTTALELRACIN